MPESPTSAATPMQSSREQLFHLLAEAAELEHNILCSYLYAAFSLKQRRDEDLSAEELRAVEGWRGDLMGLCIEEMVHLAQVSNLMVALGCNPHFNRPNFPVPAGYHPAGIVLALTPFDLDAIEHFIFLERPVQVPVADSAPLAVKGVERPEQPFTPLMPRAPHYETIGEFYNTLRTELDRAAADMGEQALFTGDPQLQLTPGELKSPELVVVRDSADARRAIDFIVEQGEGSGQHRDGSHFGRFEAMRDEFLRLRAQRPEFEPSRQVARHPVMHVPVAADRVWIDGRRAAPVLDAANAAYSAMLRCLAQLYASSHPGQREALLVAALAAMQAVMALGIELTELPASDSSPTPRAGMSFAMLRAVEGLGTQRALPVLAERLDEIAERVQALGLSEPTAKSAAAVQKSAAALRGQPCN